MRKIDKTCNHSSKYKNWENQLEENNEQHPPYNSSKHKYYNDIRMQLFHCQKGACAYTEQALCKTELYDSSNWNNGEYVNEKYNPGDVKGQLDHFDPSLKENKAWLWDNFFMISSDVNVKAKGRNLIYHKLKPDLVGYDPNDYFEYDFDEHIIIPKRTLPEDEKKIIEQNIIFLGLNNIDHLRKDYIKSTLLNVYLGIKTFEELEINQFYTSIKWFNDYLIREEKDLLDL